MALRPIDTCTPIAANASAPQQCTYKASANITHYPTYCNSTTTSRMCYIVSNYDPPPQDSNLKAAMANCCSSSADSHQSCIKFCPSDKSMEGFNECLESYGVGPTYNNTGVVRDTYCAGGGLGDVQGGGGGIVTVSSGAAKVQSVKAGLGLGLLMFFYAVWM